MEENSGSVAPRFDPNQITGAINTVVGAASAFAGFGGFIQAVQDAIDTRMDEIEAAAAAAVTAAKNTAGGKNRGYSADEYTE